MRRGIVAAATSTINLSALGASVLGAAAFQSWALFALGGAAYAALAAWDLASEGFWRKLREDKRESLSLPAAAQFLDVEVRSAVTRIHAARAAISGALAEAPEHVRAHVEVSLVGLDELEERVARLVELAEAVARHLSSVDTARLASELGNLQEKLASTSDKQSKDLYEEAAKAREEQLNALNEVKRARERLLANLARIVANLEGVPTRVVRMRVLDAQSGSGEADIGWDIGHMNTELAAIEQTLEVLVSENPS